MDFLLEHAESLQKEVFWSLASTVIGTFEGFSFSKLLNPFTPTPFFERTA